MKTFEIFRELTKSNTDTVRNAVGNMHHRLAWCKVTTNLQFVKSQYLQSAIKQNTIKPDMPINIYSFLTARIFSITSVKLSNAGNLTLMQYFIKHAIFFLHVYFFL